MISDLRKNFTLLNVVGYLTILNPQVLLDNVSVAMDVLQDCLQEKFDGKTLIGLYIHVCCLIERLVTKTAITEFDDLENFEKHICILLSVFMKHFILYRNAIIL